MTEQKENLTLADAILMGSSVIKPVAGVQMTAEMDSGCALGMANKAKGVEYVVMTPEEATQSHLHRMRTGERERSIGTAAIWGNWVKTVVPVPCGCWGGAGQIQDVITHLFDSHVMDNRDRLKWTIEQLADWVRSVEGPAREEETKKLKQIAEEQRLRWEREGAYPITYMRGMSPWKELSIGGAMRPGNHINPDGSVTLEPRHGAYASYGDLAMDPFAGMASNATAYSQQQIEEMKKLTLDDLEKLVDKMTEMIAEAK